MEEIKIGNGNLAEALRHVAASFAEIEKKKKEEQKNVHEFSEAVEKLAKKHKVLFFLQAFDKDASSTINRAPYTVAKDYGFEDMRHFAHAVESSAKDLSETAYKAALAAGMLIEEHCNEGSDNAE